MNLKRFYFKTTKMNGSLKRRDELRSEWVELTLLIMLLLK